MTTLIKRHMILFFKDKASVFFSLFSVFIIIVLYILFLSENIISNLPEFPARSAFVFLWMFSGVIAVTTATAVLGALNKYIEDKVNSKHEDLLVTQITKSTLAYSYIIYSFIVGVVFAILLLLFGYIYTYIKFDILLNISLTLIVIVLLSTLMHTLLFYLITSALKTISAFSGISTVVGTIIGFLAGIYIPIGILPSYLQKIITLFPTTQATVLLKGVLMKDVLKPMSKFIPAKEYNDLTLKLGIDLMWNNQLLTKEFSWCYLIILTVLLFSGILIRNKRKM